MEWAFPFCNPTRVHFRLATKSHVTLDFAKLILAHIIISFYQMIPSARKSSPGAVSKFLHLREVRHGSVAILGKKWYFSRMAE